MRAGRFKLIGAVFVLGAAIASGASAQPAPTTQDLDRRMRTMEQNMETILRLLQSQQGGQPAIGATAPQVAPSLPAPRVRGGVLNLDVFARPVSDQDRSIQGNDPARLPNGPNGIPSGTTLISAPAKFLYADFVGQSALSRFQSFQGNLGLSWNGVIQITDEGQHTFELEIAQDQTQLSTCRGVLRVNNEIVVDTQYQVRGWNDSATQQGGRRLSPGVYAFSIWLICSRFQTGSDSFRTITSTVTMAGPRDRAALPIPPARFGVLQ
jgi:hypothetical protein